MTPELLRRARAVKLAGQTIVGLTQGLDVPEALSVFDPPWMHMKSWNRPRCEAAATAVWGGWLALKESQSFPKSIVADLLPETEDVVLDILRGLTYSLPELKAYSRQCQLRAAKLTVTNATAIEVLAKELLKRPRIHRAEVVAIVGARL